MMDASCRAQAPSSGKVLSSGFMRTWEKTSIDRTYTIVSMPGSQARTELYNWKTSQFVPRH